MCSMNSGLSVSLNASIVLMVELSDGWRSGCLNMMSAGRKPCDEVTENLRPAEASNKRWSQGTSGA